MASLVGESLGRYRVVARLGRGGMAEVYKAYQPGLDRYVAIKVLHGHLVDDADFIGRFEREALAIGKLRHPGIVQALDFDREGDLYFMAMEYIEGPTLKDEIKARRASGREFAFEEVSRIFTALCSAIDYAHGRGMVHRDIKPANVMINQEGQIVLTDFGISRILGGTQYTDTGALAGTPAYMSPEQGQGERGDERSDIYSLGVMLYETATGVVPYDADTPFAVIMRHISEPLPMPSKVNPDISDAVERVMLKALSKDPDERYQTAGDMALDLRKAVGLAAEDTLQRTPLITVGTPQRVQEIDHPTGPLTRQERMATVARAVRDGATVTSDRNSFGAAESPRRTNLSIYLNLLALILLLGAIILILLPLISTSGIRDISSLITPWMTISWPWLVLFLGIAIAIVANRRNLVGLIVDLLGSIDALVESGILFIDRKIQRVVGLRKRNKKTERFFEPETNDKSQVDAEDFPGVTLLSSPAQMLSTEGTIFMVRPNMEGIFDKNEHLVEAWLKQDIERIGFSLGTNVSTRLLLTGFGSFGGTSLVRATTAKLMKKSKGKTLVIRLGSSRHPHLGHYELFVNENRAGFISSPVNENELSTILDDVLMRRANTDSSDYNFFEGMTFKFDQSGAKTEDSDRKYAIAQLIGHIVNLLESKQSDVELRQTLDRLFADSDANSTRQIILVIDRVEHPESMERLLNSAINDAMHYFGLSIILVVRYEDLNAWPSVLLEQIPQQGFTEYYVRYYGGGPV